MLEMSFLGRQCLMAHFGKVQGNLLVWEELSVLMGNFCMEQV